MCNTTLRLVSAYKRTLFKHTYLSYLGILFTIKFKTICGNKVVSEMLKEGIFYNQPLDLGQTWFIYRVGPFLSPISGCSGKITDALVFELLELRCYGELVVNWRSNV